MEGLIVVPLILTENSGEGVRGGLYNIMSSILDRFSLRKWCDIQANMSVSKSVMRDARLMG